MKKLLFATTNPAKLKEMQFIFRDVSLEIVTMKQYPEIPEVEETGTTFRENAIIKAKYYLEKTGVSAIADDGGLVVDALGGAPGVKSHRWLGKDASDLELAQTIVERMKGIPRERRTARLGGVMVFYDGREISEVENFTEGYITEDMPREVETGFPYRGILIIAQFNKIYQDLTHEEHEIVNHRRKNLYAIKPKILAQLSEK